LELRLGLELLFGLVLGNLDAQLLTQQMPELEQGLPLPLLHRLDHRQAPTNVGVVLVDAVRERQRHGRRSRVVLQERPHARDDRPLEIGHRRRCNDGLGLRRFRDLGHLRLLLRGGRSLQPHVRIGHALADRARGGLADRHRTRGGVATDLGARARRHAADDATAVLQVPASVDGDASNAPSVSSCVANHARPGPTVRPAEDRRCPDNETAADLDAGDEGRPDDAPQL